jgi:hypothetical protein
VLKPHLTRKIRDEALWQVAIMNKLNRQTLTLIAILTLAIVPGAWAQTCSSGADMEAPTRSAIESAVSQYFQMAQQGNTAGLQSASAPDFTDVASVVNQNKLAFTGTPSLTSEYLLDNTDTGSGSGSAGGIGKQGGRSEFFCGVYNSPDRVGFAFPALSPGLYSVVLQDVKSDKGDYSLAWILHKSGNQWRIAGLIPKSTEIGGHDGDWFLQQARAYKSKGQMHNAWFYYVMGDQLLRPLGAMSTPQFDKLYDEFQSTRPSDLPANDPVPLAASGKTYNLTTIFPVQVGDAVDLVVKYQSSDVSDVSKAYQDNMAVIKALVEKYPELREAFGGIVARAVAPSGQDYGTLLAMKDVK